MSRVLVTGASSGIGFEFCRELASRGHDIVMVARRVSVMEEQAAQLKADYGVDIRVVGANLANLDDVAHIARLLCDPQEPISLLVNNAGFATQYPFHEQPFQQESAAFNVMVRAPFTLTHAALQTMTKRGRGGIINVSSMIAGKGMATYSAHKAWLSAFSMTIHKEVRDLGVLVTCVEPGTVMTDFWGDEQDEVAKASPPGTVLTPRDVVSSAMKALNAGQPLCIPGTTYKTLNVLSRIVPRSAMAHMGTKFARRRFN